jgi:mono/diheme cytochrome c family protein
MASLRRPAADVMENGGTSFMRENKAEMASAMVGLARRGGWTARRASPLLLAIALLATSSPSRAEQKLAPMAQAGREEFTTYCTPCHGHSGIGDGVAAPALKQPPADLTRIAARRNGRFPDDEIAAVIDGRSAVMAHGTRDMPIWGERFADDATDPDEQEPLTQGRVAVLIAYLKTIQVDVPGPKSSAAPK